MLQTARFRVMLKAEHLEVRCVPTVYRWTGADDNNWSTPTNWQYNTVLGWQNQSTAFPSIGDEALFIGQFNSSCNVDVPVTVDKVSIGASYGRNIVLLNPLTVGSAPGTGLSMDSTGASIRGFVPGTPAAQGTLNLVGQSVSKWVSGNISNVTVNIQRADNKAATLEVGGTSTRRMNGSAIVVDGILSWITGNVDVATATDEISSVQVQGKGEFLLNPSNSTWGVVDNVPQSRFVVQNKGSMIVDSTNAAILNGEFSNYGTVKVEAGSLGLTSRAEQFSGSFELLGTAVVLPGEKSKILRIYDGTFKGSGTVDGNITFGYDPLTQPGQKSSPTFQVGEDGKVGSVTVTANLQIFSPSTTTKFRVDDQGKASQIAVNGYAALAGDALIEPVNAKAAIPFEHLLVDVRSKEAIIGSFANLEEGTTVGVNGTKFTSSYLGGTGNELVLLPKDKRGAYFNGFEPDTSPRLADDVTAVWSDNKTSITPSGRSFLGEFGNQNVTLSLDNLSAHEYLIVSFDLYILKSWDGSDVLNKWGPDGWSLGADGQTLLSTSFSNQPLASPGAANNVQAFGGQGASPGSYAAFAGASEINTLGYQFYRGSYGRHEAMDSVYRLEFIIPHTADSSTLSFRGFGLQGLGDESWGIDNVTVSLA